MYYVSPFTYLTSSMLSVGVANTKATCLDYEFLKFSPPSGQTCGQYLQNYITRVGSGYVDNPNATDTCAFCQVSDTNVFLSAVSSNYSDRWRNFGIMWGYVVFNIFMALFLYWLVRVPKKSKETMEIGAPLTGLDVVEKKSEEDNDVFATPTESPKQIGGRGGTSRNSSEEKKVYEAEEEHADPPPGEEKKAEAILEKGGVVGEAK
jgi:hypothetical protein